jgi:WD40 repeat protein
MNYYDHGVQLWSVTDPHRPAWLSTIPTSINEGSLYEGSIVAFSADGHTVAIASSDDTVHIWNVTDPRHPRSVAAFGFGAQVKSLSLTPDGHQLYVAAEGNVVQHRYVDVDDVAAKICAVAYPRLTTTEWRDHFPNLAYDPPCR